MSDIVITKVTELGEQLRLLRQQRVEFVETGVKSEAVEDNFVSADRDAFLDKTLEAINAALVEESAADALVGPLEENAFLAAFQNQRNAASRARVQKWAGIYSLLKTDADPTGIIEKQIKTIGAEVDEPMQTQVYRLGEPSSG